MEDLKQAFALQVLHLAPLLRRCQHPYGSAGQSLEALEDSPFPVALPLNRVILNLCG